jgi:hypothetical protein
MIQPNDLYNPKQQMPRADLSFITKSNFINVLTKLNYSKDAINLEDLYMKKLQHILSIPELSLLYIFKEACKDPDLIFECYKRIEKNKDTKKWVYEGGVPAYHCNSGCEKLVSDYWNMEIPPEIESKGDSAILRFRNFVIKNRYLLENDEQKFILRLSAEFFLKNTPKTVLSNNSGVSDIDNICLEDLETRINSLLINAEKFRNKDLDTKLKIAKLGYGTHKVKEARDPDSVLFTWHNIYKKDLKNLLCHYFRIKFNPELEFRGDLLDNLGFLRCKACHDK